MTRNRSTSSIIGKGVTKRPVVRPTRKKSDNKVPCYCNKCNGKLVLNRTKLFHELPDSLSIINEDSTVKQLPNLGLPNLGELSLDTESPAETDPALRIEALMIVHQL